MVSDVYTSCFRSSGSVALDSQGKFPTWHAAVILVPTVLYSSQRRFHCKFNSNGSLGSLGNQVLRDQERSISHFSSERRDKEMVRQRESGRKRGLEKEGGGCTGSLTLKDASFLKPLSFYFGSK